MLSALLSGSHIKRDGTIRSWDCVEYYGHHKSSGDGETMVRVMEQGEIKQINLSTFSGIIISNDEEFIYENGKRTSKQAYYLPF